MAFRKTYHSRHRSARWHRAVPHPQASSYNKRTDSFERGNGLRAHVGSDVKSFQSPLRSCPAFLTAAVQVRTDIEFRQVAGESLKLYAHIPEGPGPFAAVIVVHGGGWTARSKQASFIKPFFPLLDESGLAWFSIDYRLAPKYPYPAAVENVEAAIRYIKQNAREFRIDVNRLALTGESAGGHLVALVAAKAKPDTAVAAVVSFYGAFDLETLVAGSGHHADFRIFCKSAI
jgi:acetyl esterase/lipase